MDVFDNLLPQLRLFSSDLIAQVAQHFGCAPLPNAHVDRSLVEPRLRGGKPGHGGEKRNQNPAGFLGDRHPFRVFSRGASQWPAIERLFIGIVELQATGPGSVLHYALDNNIDSHVPSFLPAAVLAHFPHVQVPPQEVRTWYRYGNQISAVDGHSRALFRCGLSRPFLVPTLEPDVPEGQRLHGGGFSRVVRSGEDHRIAQFDLDLSKTLEVADGEFGEHQKLPFDPVTAGWSGA